MMKKINTLLLVLWLFVATVVAQTSTISGIVVEEGTNSPLIGVSVKLVDASTPTATMTDIDGKFSINAKVGDKLEFSFVGMLRQTLKVESASTMHVTMEYDAVMLEGVVAIGYGTVKKSDLSGAVAAISGKDLNVAVAKSAASALQGKVAGVRVSNMSGAPGEGMNIDIRGVKNLSAQPPLYVIDGVYGDINILDPTDIESLQVLKDASAAAIYGSRAANGVVLIKTKTGRKDSPTKLSLNVQTGIQQLSKKLKVMDGGQWQEFARQTMGRDYSSNVNTDWQDELYRTAATYKVNLGISGGANSSTYDSSIGYYSQDGIMINSGYESVNLRMKSEHSFIDNRLTIGQSILFKTGKQKTGNNGALVHQAIQMIPTIPVYDSEREYGWGGGESWMANIPNPVGDAYVNSGFAANNIRSTEALINAYMSLKIYDNLVYKVNLGFSKDHFQQFGEKLPYDFGRVVSHGHEVKAGSTNEDMWMLENTLNYDKTFGKHNVYALLGYSAESFTQRVVNASGTDIPLGISVVNGGKTATGNSSRSDETGASYFARLMYSYDSRYMLSASIRRDGSSKFESGKRWGSFPSVSVGWNIHNEAFAEGLKPAVDELKFRASYGKLGNKVGVPRYATQSRVSSGINYLQAQEWWKGQMSGINWVSPKDLKWETSETYNVGLDLATLNNSLLFTTDLFIADNKDILLAIPMPQSAGLNGQPTLNAGTFRNKGAEFSVTYRNSTANGFFYSVTGNATYLNQKMKEITIGGETAIPGFSPQGLGTVTYAKLGRPASGMYLVETDGIFQTQAEVDAYVNSQGERVTIFGKLPKVGDMRYKNVNDDAEINNEDATYQGSGIPNWTFGISANFEYKGFDLGLFFDAVAGNKIYNFTKRRMYNTSEVFNYSPDVFDSWTEDNRSNTLPKYGGNDNGNHNVMTTRWLENGSYFRLRTLDFGYTLPKSLLSKIKLDNVRVYTSFENLFTITGYSGYTPDLGSADGGALNIGVDHGRYPLPRIMSLGIQINL